MTNSTATYYTATKFKDADLNTYNVSENPSPYRNRDVIWVPVTLVGPDWVLTNNNSVIVNTADVFNISLGNYVLLKP
jgi:hypothetical protein